MQTQMQLDAFVLKLIIFSIGYLGLGTLITTFFPSLSPLMQTLQHHNSSFGCDPRKHNPSFSYIVLLFIIYLLNFLEHTCTIFSLRDIVTYFSISFHDGRLQESILDAFVLIESNKIRSPMVPFTFTILHRWVLIFRLIIIIIIFFQFIKWMLLFVLIVG